MKLINKIICLICIVIITYPLGWTCYIHYGVYNFYPWFDQTRHIVGYGILGWIFGWITLPLAILDELIQLFIPSKTCNLHQILSNFLSALAGITLRQFIRLSFRNPFKNNK